jgi:hypothetical protein
MLDDACSTVEVCEEPELEFAQETDTEVRKGGAGNVEDNRVVSDVKTHE